MIYVAPSAVLVGDVTVEEGASLWHGAVALGGGDPRRPGKDVSKRRRDRPGTARPPGADLRGAGEGESAPAARDQGLPFKAGRLRAPPEILPPRPRRVGATQTFFDG